MRQRSKVVAWAGSPKHIAEALKAGKKVEPENHELVTIVFSDIKGFTDISRELSPMKVSVMLDNLYLAFDRIAGKHGVFKVETIGDCYVAVVGLPEPADDHALIMARFARACMTTMTEVVHTLELTLGPGTSDLAMRFGLHSGPVTAGVLRGDKSRFQLL